MPLQHQFNCPLPNGVHARPASLLEEISRNFNSTMTLTNQRTGRQADGKSVLSIISADIRYNDPCLLTVSGPDEQGALAKLADFLHRTFPHCDDALPALPKLNGKPHLPPGLRAADVTCYDGVPVVPGVGRGHIRQVGGFKIPAALTANGTSNPDAEWKLIDEALIRLNRDYDEHLNRAQEKIEMDMLKAQRAIARDSEFYRQLHTAIIQGHQTAAGAVAGAQLYFSKVLAASGSERLRERILDVQDVCLQVLRQIYGDAINASDVQISSDSIVAAESLTPGQFLALDRRFLKGLVLANAGVTSHTIILARSFGIPTLVGIPVTAHLHLEGQEAIIDADAGVLVMNPPERARRYYDRECQRIADRQAYIKKSSVRPARTKDGQRIEIAANIASAEETAAVFAAGAEGIGLFRTEMLFLDRNSPPDEAEQFQAYCRVLKAAGDRPVIIRTLDVGGDKPLDYLKLPVEENPFLGCRAVRLYPKFEPLFRTQIRALIRASAQGKLKLLIPMISTVDEVRWVKQIIAEEQARCRDEKIKFDPALPVGAMIEVPAAAFAMDELCRMLDFFSIGSNDLLQYFTATDRANASLKNLCNPLLPAFLRLLKQIIDDAHAHKKWIGLCGEMGGQVEWLPLLVGLGLDEISATAPVIGRLKAELAGWATSECKQLLAEALNCVTAGEVETILKKTATRPGVPLIEPELILIEDGATTKEEAIKLVTDRLYVLGRTDDSRGLEQAVLQREQSYSTGFGHGFAIPHCKTDAVRFNSLVLVKLKTPVDWNALDGKPVGVVILLALRENDKATKHMQVLAKLARRLMDEGFRVRLESETDPNALYKLLKENLGIEP